MSFDQSKVRGPVRCAIIGTMGKRYAVMIDRGMIEGMSLAAVC